MKQILRRYALLLAGVFLWAGPLQAAEAPGKVVETYEEMPAGFTADGHPYLGKADAPVVLEEWSDYLCPFCGRHFRQTLPALKEKYVRSGQVKLVFRDMPIASLHPTASLGHLAARCVARQGSAAHYWTMHDALFSRQAEWNRLPDPSAFLAEVAEQAGADMAAYEACITSDETAKALEASVAAGQAHGFNGTPSFRLIEDASGNAYKLVGARAMDYFSPRIDALVAGEKPPEDPKPKPAELPSWAKPEGLSPDPARPGYTMAGDAYKGDADARLKVIEFTDLQCPSCRRHALETQPVLDRDFVETGKVQWVVKHFPLRIHPNAAVAAAAAECAADQERFLVVHPDPQRVAEARQASQWSQFDFDRQGATKRVATARVDLGGIAKGYAIDRVNRARGDAVLFEEAYTAYRRAPEVTRRRIFLETMETIYPAMQRKILLDNGLEGVLPLLQLNGAEVKQ